MKDELFQQLAASLKEGGGILRGKKKPARSTTLQWLILARANPGGVRFKERRYMIAVPMEST